LWVEVVVEVKVEVAVEVKVEDEGASNNTTVYHKFFRHK
jgi:hypothetical protein